MYEQNPREVPEERTVGGPPDRPSLERERVALAPYNYRAVQITWFVFGLVNALIGIRFLLKMLGASPQAAFVSFMYGVTGPLVAPFRGIFPDNGQGFYIFEPASLVAMVVYLLLGWGIVVLIRIATAPKGPRRAL